ncbi:hypothetical protein [Mesorhizobium sp. M1143]|uniref:hypothetical protein n=1 Tax=Mesorhizobium sp. M1143 TaxID=2957061 RepID=UPI0033398EC2
MIGRQHVFTTDVEIEKIVAARTTDWPRAARDPATKLAVWFHRQNQNLVKEFRL